MTPSDKAEAERRYPGSPDVAHAFAVFAKEIIRRMVFEAADLDGEDVQALAVKHGLLIEVKYDPDIHDGSEISYIKPGDSWFVLSPSPPPVPDASPTATGALDVGREIHRIAKVAFEMWIGKQFDGQETPPVTWDNLPFVSPDDYECCMAIGRALASEAGPAEGER